ncbi:hypothetical protein SODALDRAFT_363465 [Sodiomyces alkalinus F11]|uniref:Uncharacterized protein n=1 Tax=Sodiomyces alkalinus (strain CBS 110278 / VKM F-3762 / F11) TaxID=1314773 RepID=A0A3N2PMP7_SODAK|nr:hypothetical protein SODALDRAFT_363465 [Sodiomyces alkalinus F11]ROT35606.1 hypothetical protein SODALDRAFT_363465 [Sodiomyces alkalinus F11]
MRRRRVEEAVESNSGQIRLDVHLLPCQNSPSCLLTWESGRRLNDEAERTCRAVREEQRQIECDQQHTAGPKFKTIRCATQPERVKQQGTLYWLRLVQKVDNYNHKHARLQSMGVHAVAFSRAQDIATPAKPTSWPFGPPLRASSTDVVLSTCGHCPEADGCNLIRRTYEPERLLSQGSRSNQEGLQVVLKNELAKS